mmetsp:Transcript_48872/g.106241  ORF Transcript_48872/g.106241 Transcript_48872/m.106241 type:complete len:717 (+) Transcript_48872:68-2218(+)
MQPVIAILLLISAPLAVRAESPVGDVVQLLKELRGRIETDGQTEQASYDKYSCWCEATLGRKSNDISTAQVESTKLQALIVKLGAEISTHASEAEQLGKDIEENRDAQREATEVRETGHSQYEGEKTESEQCIGALESAIKVLTGAGGSGKKQGFLETIQETQVLSIVAGVRDLLDKPLVSRSLTPSDLAAVKRFVEKPAEVVGRRAARAASAMQLGENPFGDYAPQSTQIQGILKGMYDAFAADLEKANVEEAEEQKAFQALMATKKAELATLEATLQKQSSDKAKKSKELADSRTTLDQVQEQMEADETFFEETKATCKTTAGEWSERTRLRTEELHSIDQATAILSSGKAQKVFENASTTFLQLGTVKLHSAFHGRVLLPKGRAKAIQHLRSLAGKYQSVSLAEMAAKAAASGHFDQVIASIDAMIDLLRKEEQDDISHRDRCQQSENKNSNDMEDLEHAKQKAIDGITRAVNAVSLLRNKITHLGDAIANTTMEMADLLSLRNEASTDFKQALKDDLQGISLITAAIETLSEFYKSNGMALEPLELAQKQAPAVGKYTKDQDKAPETAWQGEGGAYGGRRDESHGIIAILTMIREDLEMEVKTAREEEAAAESDYEAQRTALTDLSEKQNTAKATAEKELAETQASKLETEESKAQTESDLAGQGQLQQAIYTDCSWVATHFESRREKRKAEMAGLGEAKDYLAGVESGEEP